MLSAAAARCATATEGRAAAQAEELDTEFEFGAVNAPSNEPIKNRFQVSAYPSFYL